MKTKQRNSKFTETPKRKVDLLFKELDSKFLGSKILYSLFLTLAFFGVLGLIWMIPFPELNFLKAMNAHTFLNWGSFFIAIVIYLYLRLATTLSYAILLCISIQSFFIVQLEYVQKSGGPSVVLVCGLISILSVGALWILTQKEKSATQQDFFKLLTIGPIWLWSKIYNKFNIKY